jgi:hypothetical protein
MLKTLIFCLFTAFNIKFFFFSNLESLFGHLATLKRVAIPSLITIALTNNIIMIQMILFLQAVSFLSSQSFFLVFLLHCAWSSVDVKQWWLHVFHFVQVRYVTRAVQIIRDAPSCDVTFSMQHFRLEFVLQCSFCIPKTCENTKK